jgi:ABC-type uncharacterized transport system fused permease/ATPase subunit
MLTIHQQMALLGEMTLLPGGRIIMSKNPSRVDEHGLMHSISYAAQSPWLQHQSIKENILFGYPYDADRYNDVVECCALKPDLEALEDGDATEIGDRREISIFPFFVGHLLNYCLEALVCREDKSRGKFADSSLGILCSQSLHRVALARAVYARTKYVVLDDPFSAVVRPSNIV